MGNHSDKETLENIEGAIKKRTIQRNRQQWEHKTKKSNAKKEKQNKTRKTICVGHHYTPKGFITSKVSFWLEERQGKYLKTKKLPHVKRHN
jgi:hypothetical protein